MEGTGWLVRDRDPASVGADDPARDLASWNCVAARCAELDAALQADVPSRHIRFPASQPSSLSDLELIRNLKHEKSSKTNLPFQTGC